MGQIDNLIAKLQELRKKAQTNSDRIQRDITEHAKLNQQVTQLTDIISESVKSFQQLRASVPGLIEAT